MRRGRRERVENNNKFKYLLYSTGVIIAVIFITFIITVIVYNNNLKKTSQSLLTTEKIADLVPNTDEYLGENIEQASMNIGKSIEEVINEAEKKTEENSKQAKVEEKENIKTNERNIIETKAEPEEIKDPEFSYPVEGEIIRGFSKDSLIYSDTLEEWITHLGIDIKQERTSVVRAAESGKVLAIKNDPRYGLTVVLEHVNGYKTIYANLLSSEFIKEGESVEKGQTIGTVGNSASFEIVDEPHLHFEILKDDINLDPTMYLQ